MDPNLQQGKGGECAKEEFGEFAQTGASAGMCPNCKNGQGADNGIGGRIEETYGDASLTGQPDPQLYGHVYSLDYKLSVCSTAVRQDFARLETMVNEACDVKSYYRMQKCGNCVQAICRFHNELHWVTNPVLYRCAQDLFLRRLECYAKWYHKWCTCSEFSHVPYKGKAGDWEGQCVEPYYLRFEPNRADRPTLGTYPACSVAIRTAAPCTALALYLALLASALVLVFV